MKYQINLNLFGVPKNIYLDRGSNSRSQNLQKILKELTQDNREKTNV